MLRRRGVRRGSASARDSYDDVNRCSVRNEPPRALPQMISGRFLCEPTRTARGTESRPPDASGWWNRGAGLSLQILGLAGRPRAWPSVVSRTGSSTLGGQRACRQWPLVVGPPGRARRTLTVWPRRFSTGSTTLATASAAAAPTAGASAPRSGGRFDGGSRDDSSESPTRPAVRPSGSGRKPVPRPAARHP